MGKWAVELVFEGFIPDGSSPAPGAGGITALEHEISDVPVEGSVVVVSLFGELDEIPACFGGVFGKQGDGERAVRGG